MRIAVGLALIGVVLGVIAAVGLLNRPADAGDPGIIEASVTDRAASPATTTTTTRASTTTTVAPQPLWAANDTSLLADLTVPEFSRPKRLIIDTLGIDAPIGSYGVDANGQMDVPDNVTDVAWYQHGPSPGQPGSAVLAAHVDLRGPGRGLFFELDELEVDDEVVVVLSDGESTMFRVVARTTYLKSDLPLDVIFNRTGDPVLTLVTCGGGFSESARSYDSNVVVYAVPVQG